MSRCRRVRHGQRAWLVFLFAVSGACAGNRVPHVAPDESRPHITWVESVDCDTLASAESAKGSTTDHFCNGAWIDADGNAIIPWTGKISHDPGFPVVLSAYRNWLRYSSFATHTQEQAAFDQSFVEGLTSVGL